MGQGASEKSATALGAREPVNWSVLLREAGCRQALRGGLASLLACDRLFPASFCLCDAASPALTCHPFLWARISAGTSLTKPMSSVGRTVSPWMSDGIEPAMYTSTREGTL